MHLIWPTDSLHLRGNLLLLLHKSNLRRNHKLALLLRLLMMISWRQLLMIWRELKSICSNCLILLELIHELLTMMIIKLLIISLISNCQLTCRWCMAANCWGSSRQLNLLKIYISSFEVISAYQRSRWITSPSPLIEGRIIKFLNTKRQRRMGLSIEPLNVQFLIICRCISGHGSREVDHDPALVTTTSYLDIWLLRRDTKVVWRMWHRWRWSDIKRLWMNGLF